MNFINYLNLCDKLFKKKYKNKQSDVVHL